MSQRKLPTTPPHADVDAFAIDIALRLLPVCSTLAALCLAGLAYLEMAAPEAVRDTLADELLGLAGFLFLANIYLIIWTLRRGPTPRARRAARAASILFVVAMTLMMADGGYFFFVVHRDEWIAPTPASAVSNATVAPTDRHLNRASPSIDGFDSGGQPLTSAVD